MSSAERTLRERMAVAMTELKVIRARYPEASIAVDDAIKRIEAIKETDGAPPPQCQYCLSGLPRERFNRRFFHTLPSGDEVSCDIQTDKP